MTKRIYGRLLAGATFLVTVFPASVVAQTTGGTADATTAATADNGTQQDIIVTGTRVTGLKASDSPAPIQILGNDTLKRVGQTDLINALAQTLPSVQPQVFGSDQAAMHPAIKLRGLNPNHTLILIDGKRRHGTASVTLGSGPFGGNAAPDISFIPEDAIDHIEVLQDGAAAQYGTDAIAGVINIILKKNGSGGSLDATGGKYYDQGGQQYDVQGNIGVTPFPNAYFNLTAEKKFVDFAFRGDIDPRVVDTGVSTSANSGRYVIAALYPAVMQLPGYPYINRIVSTPRTQLAQFMANAGYEVTPDIDFYTFGSYAHRIGRTWQHYRLPNVVFGKNPTDIAFPLGFEPQEVSRETDYSGTAGLKGSIGDTTWDLSSTFGRDENDVYVDHSANAALYYDTSTATTPGYTPTLVHNGDFIAWQWTNTLDLTHKFDIGLASPLNVAGGVEYRKENFQLRPGEVASYYTGSGKAQGGIQSFFGYSPANASDNDRDNVSEYLDISLRPVEKLILDGAVRHEHYSDFGSTTVEKLTGRFDLSPAFAVRGTVSTGFRAPTLAEEFYSGINVNPASLSGVFAPNSPGAKSLGISGLKPEKSTNFSAGIVAHPASRLTMTLDAYQIRISNRIVNSGTFYGYSSVKGTVTSPSVLDALRANGVPVDAVISSINAGGSGSIGVSSFVNGVTTRTQGVDFVTTYSSNFGSLGNVDWSAALNYNKTAIRKLNNPPSNVNQSVQLLDLAARSNLVDSTPKFTAKVGAFWSLGKFSVNLRETYYSKTFVYTTDPLVGSQYDKIPVNGTFLTDLEVDYKLTSWLKLSAGANNLFNKYPTKYPDYFRHDLYITSSTAYMTIYPNFSPVPITGGYYYGRLNLTFR